MKRDNKLKLHFNKKINDIEGILPLSETEGKWDINLLFYHFLVRQYPDNNHSFVEELEQRGYDLTTINFNIAKATEGYTPMAKRFGLHFHPNFNDCILELKSFGYKITKFDKEEKIAVFERTLREYKSTITFKESKYNNYYFESENVRFDKYLLPKIEDTLRFLETNKFENLDVDMDYVYETIYGEF